MGLLRSPARDKPAHHDSPIRRAFSVEPTLCRYLRLSGASPLPHLCTAKICSIQPEPTHLVVQPAPGHVQLPGGQADVAAGAFESGDDGVPFVAAQVLGGLRIASRSESTTVIR